VDPKRNISFLAKVLEEQARPTPVRNVLVVLKNHESLKYIEDLHYATEHNIMFL
jgi:hypothetical protein